MFFPSYLLSANGKKKKKSERKETIVDNYLYFRFMFHERSCRVLAFWCRFDQIYFQGLGLGNVCRPQALCGPPGVGSARAAWRAECTIPNPSAPLLWSSCSATVYIV